MEPFDPQLLNPSQKEAVLTTEGRVLILAGAGSGKTRVLTMRMAHLVRTKGVCPSLILGLTFTNKAAAEMRSRIASMVEPKAAKAITLCTFHSFCMKLLREDIHRLGYTSSFTLWDEHDVKRMITLIARDILKCEGELPSLSPTIAAINQARSKGIKGEEIDSGAPWHDEFAKEVYKRLLDCMRAYNAVDFDTLLCLTVELFESHPDVLNKYQERYRYVMIDEYQDTNPIQYRIAQLLTAKYGNLCVVGDDDQSIYGWRGAEVKNILNFGEAHVIKLEQNYRSTNTILKAANGVIQNNQERHRKVLWSSNQFDHPIEIFVAPSEIEEAEAVVCRIAKLKAKHGLRWKDIAILYRSNALSRQFELALMKHGWNNHDRWVQGIPYEVYGGTEFFGRKEIKDLSSYLRFIVNPKDQEALLRIINQPRRAIGEATLDNLTQYNRTKDIPLWDVLQDIANPFCTRPHLREAISAKSLRGIEEFVSTIETAQKRFEDYPLSEAMQWLIDKIDYKKAISEEVKSDKMRAFKWENVEEFVNALAEYEQQCQKEGEGKPSISNYITSLPLKSDWDKNQKNNEQNDSVHLLTIHSAKGLEFRACFFVAVEDSIIPHEKGREETGIDEERRLMYVAITRAKEFLTISMAKQRKKMGKDASTTPSRFLFEIPKECIHKTRWDDV